MAKTDYQSVDEYVRQLPEPGQSVLRRVIALIGRAVPRAEPVISYQIAAFKLQGRALVYLAAWKEHYSVYPATAAVMAAFARELAPHRDGRGTLRFALNEPIPSQLLAGIAKIRAAEVATAEALKATKKKLAKPARKQAAAKAVSRQVAAKPARKQVAAKAVRGRGAAKPARKQVAAKAVSRQVAAKPARKQAAAKAVR